MILTIAQPTFYYYIYQENTILAISNRWRSVKVYFFSLNKVLDR